GHRRATAAALGSERRNKKDNRRTGAETGRFGPSRMTYLCVPIFVASVAQAKADIARAAEAGADLVELRIDQFTDDPELRQLLSEAVLPCILTCRPEWEGGH